MIFDEISVVQIVRIDLPGGGGGGVVERRRLRIEAQDNIGAAPQSHDSTRFQGAQPRDIT
jgi:hypothetical protein